MKVFIQLYIAIAAKEHFSHERIRAAFVLEEKRPKKTSLVATRLVVNALGLPLSPKLRDSMRRESEKIEAEKGFALFDVQLEY